MTEWRREMIRRLRAMERERREREANDLADWGDA